MNSRGTRFTRVLVAAGFIAVCIGPGAFSQEWRDTLLRADSLAARQQYDSARSLGLTALALAEQQFGSADTVTAKVLYRLGGYCTRLGENSQAENHFRRCLAIFERALPFDHPHIARALNALGLALKYQGKYAEAEPLYRTSLQLKESSLGPAHLDVANSLNNLAELYELQSKYAEAEPLYQRSIQIRSDSLGSDSPEVAKTLSRLAGLYVRWGRFDRAAQPFENAVAILRRQLPPGHPDLLEAVFQWGNYFCQLGDYRRAEELQTEAVTLWEKNHDPNLSTGLTALADSYGRQGDFARAEPLLREALAVAESMFGVNHPNVATIAGDMVLQFAAFGNFSEADRLCRRALAITEKAFGSDHLEVARLLNNLAYLRMLQGSDREADSLLQKSLQIADRILQEDHPLTASTLESLAEVRLAGRQYAAADSLLRRSEQIARAVYGDHHPTTAAYGMSRGMVALARGDLVQGDSLLKRALEISQNLCGPEHPQVAHCLELIAAGERLAGNTRLAVTAGRQALEARQRSYHRNAVVLSEADALVYCRNTRDAAYALLSSCLEAARRDGTIPLDALSALWVAKGTVTEGMMERHRLLSQASDPAVQSLWAAYRWNRLTASHLYTAGADAGSARTNALLDSLARDADSLENELAVRTLALLSTQVTSDEEGMEFWRVIPDSSILVDYTCFERATEEWNSTESHYAVAVLTNAGIDTLIDLGPADRINRLVGRFRRHMMQIAARGRATAVDVDEFRSISSDVYNAVWRPIVSRIPEQSTVIVISDAALTMVPFATLTDGQQGYLVEQHPIHYLNSVRELFATENRNAPGRGLLVMGNPDFDAVTPAAEDHNPPGTRPEDSAEWSEVQPQVSLTRGGNRFDQRRVEPLPATEREVQLLSAAWRARSGEPLLVATGPDASEETFRNSVTGRRVVHLATHGYFVDQSLPRSATPLMRGRETAPSVSPLLASGLLLAGANRRLEQPDASRDGVLSAAEVMFLDMRGTRLVVLSACETGLGEVESGEGIYGLRRAFQLAGAETIVSTLWPIPDSVTADIMVRLYSTEREELPAALRRLQIEYIARARIEKAVDHPFSWGAFTAVGEWR